jgi:hypothetical protein
MSAGAAAAASGRRCELSLEDRDSFFSIRDGLQCQCRQEKNWGGARATLGAFGGRVYYEVCGFGCYRSRAVPGFSLWRLQVTSHWPYNCRGPTMPMPE